MELIAVLPIRVTMPDGLRDLLPGEKLELPDHVGRRLLELAPGRVQVAHGSPFQVGDQVSYRTPINIKSPQHYDWQVSIGTVRAVDPVWQMILIVPESEPGLPLVWVARCYVQVKESPHEDHRRRIRVS